jgi:hypothetical protein
MVAWTGFWATPRLSGRRFSPGSGNSAVFGGCSDVSRSSGGEPSIRLSSATRRTASVAVVDCEHRGPTFRENRRVGAQFRGGPLDGDPGENSGFGALHPENPRSGPLIGHGEALKLSRRRCLSVWKRQQRRCGGALGVIVPPPRPAVLRERRPVVELRSYSSDLSIGGQKFW